jgi:hypothetical protein
MCYSNLVGIAIPDTDPVEHYTLLVGIEVRGVYDGVLFWECPFCDARINRFHPGTDLWLKADPYVRSLHD